MSSLVRFAPALAAGPVLIASLAAALPAAPRDAAVADRSPLGVSSVVAARPVVPGGRLVFAPYGLSNTSAEPLTLVKVDPDCGCLAPLVDRTAFDPAEPRTIPPGAGVELILQADTAREAVGPHEHTVDLTCETAAGETVRQRVRMRYAVGPHELRIDPPGVIVMQGPGARSVQTITVTDRRDDPVRVVAVRSPAAWVRAEALEPVARPDGGYDLPFEITVDGCPGGGADVTVSVEVDDPAGRYRLLKLPVLVRPATLGTGPNAAAAGDAAG